MHTRALCRASRPPLRSSVRCHSPPRNDSFLPMLLILKLYYFCDA